MKRSSLLTALTGRVMTDALLNAASLESGMLRADGTGRIYSSRMGR